MDTDGQAAGSTLEGLGSPLAAAAMRVLDDGFYVVDRAGRLTHLSPAGAGLLGYPAEELLGRDATEALQPGGPAGASQAPTDDPALGVLEHGGTTRAASVRFTRKDGTSFDAACTASAVVEDGAVLGAVVAFRDVTDARAVEQRAAELAEERARSGAEWQRNLLPSRIAPPAGIDAAVSFRPAGHAAVVGGDFYDVIPCGEGHLLVLGDVRGKGAGAAVIGAMVRHLLRGAASGATSVEQLLQLVNAELLAHPSDRFCTLALVHLVPRGDGAFDAAACCAGHPKPVLLRADGRASPVGGATALLGVLADLEIAVEDVRLHPGDTLALYSDGLTDVGRRADHAPVDVARVLSGSVGATSAETVSQLEEAAGVLEVEDPPDDVAVLVVRAHPAADVPSAPPPPRGSAPAAPEAVGDVEAAFRATNERLVEGRPADEEVVAVLCECGHPDCRLLLEAPREVYDRVRHDDRSFLIIAGHEIPRAENIIERHGDYCLVRKHGPAGAAAVAAAEEL